MGTSEAASTLLDDVSAKQELEESRRSRDRSEDGRCHQSLGSTRSEYRGNFDEDRYPRLSESRRSCYENDNSSNQVQVK